MWRHGSHVSGGRYRNAGLPEVRHHFELALRGQTAHADGFGQPAHTSDVRLHHGNASPIHEVQKLEPGTEPLSRRDGNVLFGRKARVARQIVGGQGRLEEEQIEWLPCADGFGTRVGVGKRVLHVHHQHEIFAEGAPHGRDHTAHLGVRGLQSLVRVRTGRRDLQFRRAETATLCIKGPLDHRGFVNMSAP
jgi:hypothetical protein